MFVAASARMGLSASRLAVMWQSVHCLLGQKTDGQNKAFLLRPMGHPH